MKAIDFAFKDWKEAFELWRVESKTHKVQLVIATHWITSGYWIEDLGTYITETDYLYKGDEVLELEKRLKEKLNGVENWNGGLIL